MFKFVEYRGPGMMEASHIVQDELSNMRSIGLDIQFDDCTSFEDSRRRAS